MPINFARWKGLPFGNELLAGLPPELFQAELRPRLSRVTLVPKQVLQERDTPVTEVFFIEQGLAAVVADPGNADPVLVALVGRAGFIGIPGVLSGQWIAAHRAVVLVGGSALRIGCAALRETMANEPALRQACLEYAALLLMQTLQLAACNARHSLTGRLATLLLRIHDELNDGVPVQQEFLAAALGVRRPGISLALNKLASESIVHCARGHLMLLDRHRLHRIACNCYDVLQHRTDRAE